MSNLLISAIFIVALLGCILATLLIRMMIIAGINSKRDVHSQISFLNRDFLGILSLHRKMYPKSLLRKYIILTLALTVALGLSFTLVQNLRN
jgi:pilus assembly protein TadC